MVPVLLLLGVLGMIKKEFQGSMIFHIHSRSIFAPEDTLHQLHMAVTPRLSKGLVRSREFWDTYLHIQLVQKAHREELGSLSLQKLSQIILVKHNWLVVYLYLYL